MRGASRRSLCRGRRAVCRTLPRGSDRTEATRALHA